MFNFVLYLTLTHPKRVGDVHQTIANIFSDASGMYEVFLW